MDTVAPTGVVPCRAYQARHYTCYSTKAPWNAFLREDRNPITGVDAVLSANAWPHIERFVIERHIVIGVVVEHGCACTRFRTVHDRIAKYLRTHFRRNLQATLQDESPYPTLTWEYGGFPSHFQVISDRVVNLNPLFVDRAQFGRDLAGTFVFASGSHFAVLPTAAVLLAQKAETLVRMIVYLQIDIAKRRDSIALFNMPTAFEPSRRS